MGPPGFVVDLTAEGTADWVHWGLNAPDSFNHKAGVAPQIPNVVLLNALTSDLTNYSGNLATFSWSDGIPTPTTESATGILLWTTNNPPSGFQLTVPATTNPRNLELYVGLSYAQGKLDAWLSDFSALPYSDASVAEPDNDEIAAYSLTFASPNPGANLVVTWTPVEVFNSLYGNLSWQAATLSGVASPPLPSRPLLRVVYPPPVPNTFALSFYAQSGFNYTVQFTNDVGGALGSTNWPTLTNFVGSGADTVVLDPGPGADRRFYRVLVQ